MWPPASPPGAATAGSTVSPAQVAQYDYPGPDGASARPRTSPMPLEKPAKDIPMLFV
jgi:hypothetical protein